jgi:hypothetical protein
MPLRIDWSSWIGIRVWLCLYLCILLMFLTNICFVSYPILLCWSVVLTEKILYSYHLQCYLLWVVIKRGMQNASGLLVFIVSLTCHSYIYKREETLTDVTRSCLATFHCSTKFTIERDVWNKMYIKLKLIIPLVIEIEISTTLPNDSVEGWQFRFIFWKPRARIWVQRQVVLIL